LTTARIVRIIPGMKNDRSDYLTANQAAHRLGLSRQRVSVLVRSGRIPTEMLAGHPMIKRSELEKFASIKRPTGRPPKTRQKSVSKKKSG
jgi:excisionase family DNA binding protein